MPLAVSIVGLLIILLGQLLCIWGIISLLLLINISIIHLLGYRTVMFSQVRRGDLHEKAYEDSKK